MTEKFNPFIYGGSRGIIWTLARVESELRSLASLKFFEYQTHEVCEGSFHVIGRIGSRQVETGKLQTMVVSMVYPRQYPWEVPRVLDYEKRFQPSAKGHQFVDYGLCLSFPLRGEFTVGSEALGCEVLRSSLVWLEKRFIFERMGRWPGEQEEHGWSGPLRQLLVEEASKSSAISLRAWTDWIIADLVPPNYDGGCPCCSGQMFRRCHRKLAKLVCLYMFWSREERKLHEPGTALEAA
jgi:hypothetical protein